MDRQAVFGQVKKTLEDLLKAGPVKPYQIIVVGCSTSEILGKRIGTCSNVDIDESVAQAVF